MVAYDFDILSMMCARSGMLGSAVLAGESRLLNFQKICELIKSCQHLRFTGGGVYTSAVYTPQKLVYKGGPFFPPVRPSPSTTVGTVPLGFKKILELLIMFIFQIYLLVYIFNVYNIFVPWQKYAICLFMHIFINTCTYFMYIIHVHA